MKTKTKEVRNGRAVTFKVAAVLEIATPAKYTPAGRRELAGWLRRQANALETYGMDYANHYRARYLYHRIRGL